jgi:hypothetical protein
LRRNSSTWDFKATLRRLRSLAEESSPARAASMVASSARRLVYAATLLMRETPAPIFLTVTARPLHLVVGGRQFFGRGSNVKR